MNQIVKLMIDLQVYGLESREKISFSYKENTLSKIDEELMGYESLKQYLSWNREWIKNKYLSEKPKSSIPPIDIELKNVYIRTPKKDISPLFQKILVKPKNTQPYIVSLEELVKKKMCQNNIFILYKCDKEARINDETYESIFQDCDPKILERLELSLITIKDIKELWNFFKSKSRFSSIIRFLLSNYKDDELRMSFEETIPKSEQLSSTHIIKSSETKPREILRVPYRD